MINGHTFASRAVAGRAGVAVLLLLAVACGGGGGDKPTSPVIVTPVLTTVSVSLTAISVVVGQTATASASGLDQNGASISTGTVTWTSSSPTVASVSLAGVVTGVAAGQASITANAGGKQGQATVAITLPPVATVTVTPASAILALGATVQLAAATLDGGGAALTGRTVTWSTSDATKASVSATGLVTGIASGTVTLSAMSEGKSGTATISVAPPPVAAITIAPTTSTIGVAGTTTLTATATDASGNVLTGRTYAWTSSAPTVATGTANANVLTVTGIGAGTATITATSEGKNATATVVVTAAQVAISSVTPATLVPGGNVVISGSGFSATPSANTVTIGGVAATVTGATATQLSVTLSPTYACMPTGNALVSVTASGVTATKQQTLQVATPVTLNVGQSASFLDAQSIRCNELAQTGGRYLISIFNSSTTASSNASVTFNGATSTAASASAATTLPARTSILAAGASRSPEEVALRAGRRDHFAQLERNRQIYAQIRADPAVAAARAARARTLAAGPVTSAVTVPLTVGSKVTMHYVQSGSSCNTFVNVTARVVSVTTHGIVLEDSASATAGQIDTELNALGQLFENSLYSIEANFGNINGYDAGGALSNAGRVVMLFTPQQNVPSSNGGIVVGHVITCDFAPTAVSGYAGSNQTKIFYARAPTSTSTNASTQDSKGWWNAIMPSTLVHEAKHITAFAERFSRNANTIEESWLEEATAQIASEIYGRSVYTNSSWKGNATYANTIYCDARIGFAQCPNPVRVMQSHFLYLYDYFRNNESKSILSPGSLDGDIYGSAWMFARWLVDQYGGATESTMLQAIVQESSLTGVANVTTKTGVAWSALLADWTMMLVADDYPGYMPPVGAKYTFPSWNMRSIWSGFNTDFPSSYLAFPVIDRPISFGAFSVPVTLSGSATSIFELSGTQTTKQLLDLSAQPASSLIRMSILRVQ
jgi:uncharacterized protein YjdB